MNKLIVISKVSISTDPNEVENWRVLNQGYLVLNPPNDNDKFFLDVDKFFDNNGPEDWIINNGKHIIYDESKEAIEFIHSIDRTNSKIDYDEIIQILVDNGLCDKLNLVQLESLNYKFDIKDYVDRNSKVRDYMILEMDNNNKLKVAKFGAYDKNKVCYSFPFFASIIDVNSKLFPDTSSWFFYFVTLEVENLKTIAFLVDFGDINKTKKYYDYSHIPPGVIFLTKPRFNNGIRIGNTFSIGGEEAIFIKNDLIKNRRF